MMKQIKVQRWERERERGVCDQTQEKKNKTGEQVWVRYGVTLCEYL